MLHLHVVLGLGEAAGSDQAVQSNPGLWLTASAQVFYAAGLFLPAGKHHDTSIELGSV